MSALPVPLASKHIKHLNGAIISHLSLTLQVSRPLKVTLRCQLNLLLAIPVYSFWGEECGATFYEKELKKTVLIQKRGSFWCPCMALASQLETKLNKNTMWNMSTKTPKLLQRYDQYQVECISRDLKISIRVTRWLSAFPFHPKVLGTMSYRTSCSDRRTWNEAGLTVISCKTLYGLLGASLV
jgi:hypothetical protein